MVCFIWNFVLRLIQMDNWMVIFTFLFFTRKTEKFENLEFRDNVYFFCFVTKITILEKLISHYQICYKFWFMLFNLIIASVFFCGNLNKIPENLPALQKFWLVNHIEWDKNVNTVYYLQWLTFDVFMLRQ